jgi:hypothetical protein
MGVRVNATSSDTMIANVAVRPKEFQNFPTRPPMKATGRKITTSEIVVAVTAREISLVPEMAASKGVCPSSSVCRKMFSRTMMASSITIPVDSESPSIVRLFSVKPAMRMATNVATMEAGMATAAMKAGRSFRTARKNTSVTRMARPVTLMRSSGSPQTNARVTASTMASRTRLSCQTSRPMNAATMRLARSPPRRRWSCTSWNERLMKRERSRTTWNRMSWGSPFCTSARRSLTRSTTATVLVPDCFRMSMETALALLRRERVRGSSSASLTRATSRTRTGLPLKSATMRSLKAATDSMRPSVRRPSSLAPAVRRPPGISTFWRWRASRTCWMDRLEALSLSGLTRIWISRLRPPTSVIAPTSLTVSSARLMRLSAISVISRADRWPDTTRAMTGAESGSIFSMMGDSVPAGSRASTVPTFSRTSLAASCTFRSSTKVAKIWLWPSMVDERSSSRPLMVLTTSSMGLVIWLSISSGDAPGKSVVMVMVGRSTLGKMSTPSWTKEASPSTTRVTMTMVVKTGRRTKTSRNPI